MKYYIFCLSGRIDYDTIIEIERHTRGMDSEMVFVPAGLRSMHRMEGSLAL